MATVGITFSAVEHRGESSVWPTSVSVDESLTSSGTSAATTGTTSKGDYIRVVPTGNIWVTVSASPTAAAGTTYLVASGAEFVMFDSVGGNKVAVIDA